MTNERKRLFLNLIFPTVFVAILWLIRLAQTRWNIPLNQLGIYPRSVRGLPGILMAPLIHGSNNHLLSNSVPLIILGTIMFYFYRGIAFRIFFWLYLMTGIWVWAGARSGGAYHLGASGLIYGFVSFLFFAGIFRKDHRLMRISLLVLIFYNGLVWGVFPLVDSISWESHLLGSLAGIICAWFFRAEGPERDKFSWEQESSAEEDSEDDLEEYEEIEETPHEKGNTGPENTVEPIKVNYIFKPVDKK